MKDPEFDLANGNSYQKIVESWGINDYTSRETEQEATEYYNQRCNPNWYSHCGLSKFYCEECVKDWLAEYPTLEDFLNKWRKVYKRK